MSRNDTSDSGYTARDLLAGWILYLVTVAVLMGFSLAEAIF